MIELEKNAIGTAADVNEQRQNPRYSFSCDAAVIDIQGDMQSAESLTLQNGVATPPPGTLIAAKINRGIQKFETQGIVMYSYRRIGYGFGLYGH